MMRTPRSYLKSHIRAPLHDAAGFTLIELMVTVAIVGILMAIAVSSYEFARIKTKRSAAQSCLTEWAQYMERYYSSNTTNPMSYVGAPAPNLQCKTDLADAYGITLDASDATTFLLKAVPVPGSRQAAKETVCATMSLNQAGTKVVTGTAGTDTKQCW